MSLYLVSLSYALDHESLERDTQRLSLTTYTYRWYAEMRKASFGFWPLDGFDHIRIIQVNLHHKARMWLN